MGRSGHVRGPVRRASYNIRTSSTDRHGRGRISSRFNAGKQGLKVPELLTMLQVLGPAVAVYVGIRADIAAMRVRLDHLERDVYNKNNLNHYDSKKTYP